MEFSLNGFCQVNQIQWIVTKSKSGMTTKDTPSLATDRIYILRWSSKTKNPIIISL